jgi:hypothetical protein
LAACENDNIFSIEPMSVAILFLLGRFNSKIRHKIIIPFVTYLLVFLTYTIFIFESKQDSIGTDSEEAWIIADYVFVGCTGVMILFFFAIEGA